MRPAIPTVLRAAFLAIGIPAAVTVCGGGGTDGPASPTGTGPLITSVSVVPAAGASTSLSEGQTLQLTAVARNQAGSAVAAAVAWSSSASTVATVSASGLVVAVAPGTAVVTATATLGSSSVTGTATITVAAVPVLSAVAITPATSSVQVGGTLQLSAAPTDQNGAAIAATVAWSSASPAVATVSSSGLVSGIGAGTASITATASAGGVTVSATRSITVAATPPVLTSVSISAPTTTVNAGQTLQLSAAALDQFGAPIAATLAWSSSNTSVATVSASGLVTGVAGGAANITVNATANSVTVSDAVSVTVAVPLVLTSVAVTAPSTAVNVGATVQLTATPKDQNGSPIAATVTWSSGATSVATVSSSGLVTGVAAGTANITALATMGSATASSFLAITVNSPVFPSSANVGTGPGNVFNPTSVDIAVGGSVTWTLGGAHNVTFDAKVGAPANIPQGAGDTRTFNTAGTFPYQCTIHAGMTASVTVH